MTGATNNNAAEPKVAATADEITETSSMEEDKSTSLQDETNLNNSVTDLAVSKAESYKK
jgi:hypothetical protein